MSGLTTQQPTTYTEQKQHEDNVETNESKEKQHQQIYPLFLLFQILKESIFSFAYVNCVQILIVPTKYYIWKVL